ncbi:MAG: ArsI/CadI family heavy metal resistance metalloenzyme [Woeseiaceae bacterium]|nr:ArsI/CadI family heavy metal resistance metalloenzyme [Woeseiaceae bacterium]
MKRFHVSVNVADLERSTRFYSTLFGSAPTLKKNDYAKWMLEDPRINFSISTSAGRRGISHVGLQTDSMPELAEIQSRLRDAQITAFDQPNAQCCYANSSKTWVRDPDDVAWESFMTHGETTTYGDDLAPRTDSDAAQPAGGESPGACCGG